jgi:hypothetical protein
MDLLTMKIRSIGNLSAQWKHTLGKDKHGNDKLLPLKMNYDKSKRIFNFRALTGLYEIIDIAIGTVGYPGGVLRMQYHSTAAVPDFFFLRQVNG